MLVPELISTAATISSPALVGLIAVVALVPRPAWLLAALSKTRALVGAFPLNSSAEHLAVRLPVQVTVMVVAPPTTAIP